MIRSRRWSVGCAALAGLLATVPSMYLGTLALMAGAHVSEPDFQRILLLYLLPMLIPVGLVALLSRGWNRLWAVGVGVAGWVAGFALMFGQLAIGDVLHPEVKMVFENQTGKSIYVYYSREGENLNRHYPYAKGEIKDTAMGFKKKGAWLRIVAIEMEGSTNSNTVDELQQHYEANPSKISPEAEIRFDSRKLFDKTFTWDEIQSMGNRVVITNNKASP